TLISAAKQVILQESAVRLDYLEIVDPDSLEPISQTAWGQPPSAVRPSAARRSRSALVAIAAFVGTTRLIDNVVLNLAYRPRGASLDRTAEGGCPYVF